MIDLSTITASTWHEGVLIVLAISSSMFGVYKWKKHAEHVKQKGIEDKKREIRQTEKEKKMVILRKIEKEKQAKEERRYRLLILHEKKHSEIEDELVRMDRTIIKMQGELITKDEFNNTIKAMRNQLNDHNKDVNHRFDGIQEMINRSIVERQSNDNIKEVISTFAKKLEKGLKDE